MAEVYHKTAGGILIADRSFAKKEPVRPPMRIMRAKYDAAETSTDNTRHWANSDSLSADAANSVEIRLNLRNRARYEVANNSYARGMINTLANDTVGTGPRLQMRTADPAANKFIQREFAKWADEINLAQKLWTMRVAKAVDGETFGILTKRKPKKSPVQLGLKVVEAEMVATPWQKMQLMKAYVDGMELDSDGDPSLFYVLKSHPGDNYSSIMMEYDEIPADSVLHWYKNERPQQHRGIPEITSALPLFSQLRRYTLAVLAAAETAADFAGVLYTDSPAGQEAAAGEAFDIVNLEKRMFTTLPDGWKLGQTEAEQPTTTYKEFKNELLNEIARCLNMPFNIAACNSSNYNYSSGRLDHQTYYKSIRIEQADVTDIVLDRIFDAFIDEAILMSEFRDKIRSIKEFDHTWFWDGLEHVDPVKEASAQEIRLKNNVTTLEDEWAKDGYDYEDRLIQRGKEIKMLTDLGIPQPILKQTEVIPNADSKDEE